MPEPYLTAFAWIGVVSVVTAIICAIGIGWWRFSPVECVIKMNKEQVQQAIVLLSQQIQILEAMGLGHSDKGGNIGKCGEHLFLAGKELEKAVEALKREVEQI